MLTYVLTYKMSLSILALKRTFVVKIKTHSFLELMLINFLVWMLKCRETLILYFFAHKNMKLGIYSEKLVRNIKRNVKNC